MGFSFGSFVYLQTEKVVVKTYFSVFDDNPTNWIIEGPNPTCHFIFYSYVCVGVCIHVTGQKCRCICVKVRG